MQLIDATTNEDLILNNTIDVNSLEVLRVNGEQVEHEFYYNYDSSAFYIIIIEEPPGLYDYSITADPDLDLIIISRVEEDSNFCCEWSEARLQSAGTVEFIVDDEYPIRNRILIEI